MKQRNYIPEMTHPLGKHWNQPSNEHMLFDSKCCLMTNADFKMLLDYSASTPSGVYDGKMWKSLHCIKPKDEILEVWYLKWYEPTNDPELFDIMSREILISD